MISTSARRFLVEGLWLQRVVPPTPKHVKAVLEWAVEVASAGQPLPPLGFLADLGHAAFGTQCVAGADFPEIPSMPPGLARTYEDHVLGKLFSDWTFEVAGELAPCRYQGRDRARGLAFVVQQFRERADFDALTLAQASSKGLIERTPDDVLAEGWDSLSRDGVLPMLPAMYESLVAAARRTAEVLGAKTSSNWSTARPWPRWASGWRCGKCCRRRPAWKPTFPGSAHSPASAAARFPLESSTKTPTRSAGFPRLPRAGSVESLLHSQLVFMESDERPDLFDIKYLRDQLLFYADENQFLRRRGRLRVRPDRQTSPRLASRTPISRGSAASSCWASSWVAVASSPSG